MSTTPYTPMLSRDGTCLLMPNGTFERLESLPRYQPTAQATPAPTSAPTVAPLATASTKPASKE